MALAPAVAPVSIRPDWRPPKQRRDDTLPSHFGETMHAFLRLLHQLFGQHEHQGQRDHLEVSILLNSLFIRGHHMRVSAPNGEMFTLHIGGLTAKGIATDNLPAGVIPTLVVSGDSILTLGPVTADPSDEKKFIVDVTMVADSGTAVITAADAGLSGAITVTATPALAKSLDVEAEGSAVTVVTDTPVAVLNSTAPVVDEAAAAPAAAPAETPAPAAEAVTAETPAPAPAEPEAAAPAAEPAPAPAAAETPVDPAPAEGSAGSEEGIVASVAPAAASEGVPADVAPVADTTATPGTGEVGAQ